MAWIRCTGNPGGSLKVRTASGRIATFETNMADVLQEVKCEINATGGNGTPDNPNPIKGYTEMDIIRSGVNLVNPDTLVDGWLETDGTVTTRGGYKTTDFIPVIPSSTLYITPTGSSRCKFYDANKQPLTNSFDGNIGGEASQTFNVTSSTYYIRKTVTTANVNTFGINYPATNTAYHQAEIIKKNIQLGQTVYGGVLDVTRGKLHVTHGGVDLGTLDWVYPSSDECFYADHTEIKSNPSWGATSNIKCDIFATTNPNAIANKQGNYTIAIWPTGHRIVVRDTDFTNASTFKTAMNGHIAVYELATPFDIDLTPEQIEALLGVNNVWHDGNGDTEVKYLEIVRS